MEQAITTLLRQYEQGSIGRRQFVQSLTLLASAAPAQAAGFEGRGIDHVSLTVPEPERTAEFYKRAFGLTEVPAAPGGGALLRLGRTGDRVLIAFQKGSGPGFVDHFAIGVEPYEQDAVMREVAARGFTFDGDIKTGLYLKDPGGIRAQIIKSNPR